MHDDGRDSAYGIRRRDAGGFSAKVENLELFFSIPLLRWERFELPYSADLHPLRSRIVDR
jgi:hypothetical protein